MQVINDMPGLRGTEVKLF